MPIRMHCPECRQVLAIPSRFRGQQIHCPKCSQSFAVPAVGEESSDSQEEVTLGEDTSNGAHSGEPRSLKLAEGNSPAILRKTGQAPAVAITSRKVQFIAEEPAETSLRLGRDGRLPELALATPEQPQEKEATEKSSNPALLAALLAVSFMMSLLLLFVDFEGSGTDRREAERARAEIARDFFQSASEGAALADYQLYLRRAQQAHAHNDLEQERRWYRRVLDLLHVEKGKGYDTVTGSRERDEQLRRLLGEILRANPEN